LLFFTTKDYHTLPFLYRILFVFFILGIADDHERVSVGVGVKVSVGVGVDVGVAVEVAVFVGVGVSV